MHHTIYLPITLTVAALLICLQPAPTRAEADPAPTPAYSSKATATGAVQANEPPEDSNSVLVFYIAAGAWIAILSAATLAIIIMAHRIAVTQRIRTSPDTRHRPRSAL